MKGGQRRRRLGDIQNFLSHLGVDQYSIGPAIDANKLKDQTYVFVIEIMKL